MLAEYRFVPNVVAEFLTASIRGCGSKSGHPDWWMLALSITPLLTT